MQFRKAFFVAMLAFLSSQLAQAEEPALGSSEETASLNERRNDPVLDIDACYNLNWSYDFAEETPGARSYPDGIFGDPWTDGFYLWYCQARPLESAEFRFPAYQAYMEQLDVAQDFALLRCERDADRCVTRCALAPRVCRPHFWP